MMAYRPGVVKETTDNLIYELVGGVMTRVGVEAGNPKNRNFLIRCAYGDWSGFRTLVECENQLSELEQLAKNGKKPDGYYTVVERF
jgi:hypothetical protein